jgi:4-hydroxyphenylacetate 3-monooxygenase
MDRVKSEDAIGAKGRPFTGAEYLESLRDGREVYVYGERVKDVTAHPAFRNAARSIARLYDALHDEKTKDLLSCETDTGSDRFTHRFFRAARSREELIKQRDAIAHWARMSYGWMGRSPDYKASLMNTLGANYNFYGRFADNARAWYRRAQENVLFMNHAIVNPPVDRAKPVDQVKDVFITIQKDTDAGIYVSGAKVVATSSALTHYNFSRPECRGAAARHRSGGDVHSADERAGREAYLPRVLRDDGERNGDTVRLSVVVALR